MITGDLHDFDFLAGEWSIVNRTLRARGVGSDDWDEFPGSLRLYFLLGGLVNVDEIAFPTKGWSGSSVRIFNLERHQWSIYWVSSMAGVLQPPVVGGFSGSLGEFHGEDEDAGRRVKVRYLWTKLGPYVPRNEAGVLIRWK